VDARDVLDGLCWVGVADFPTTAGAFGPIPPILRGDRARSSLLPS